MKSSGPILYRKLKSGGYQLLEDAWIETKITGCAAKVDGYIDLESDGKITVRKGYQWDGASGIAIDRRNNMKASLFHDAFYQLHRAGKLDPDMRIAADAVYRDLYLSTGGGKVIGWLDYVALRLFAGYAARRKREVEDKVFTAP